MRAAGWLHERLPEAALASLLISTLGGLVISAQPAASADHRGSVLGGEGLEPILEIDERGLSTLRPTRHRTPSGILYPYPLRPLPYSGERLELRSFVELGYVGNNGDSNEARFRKYADLSDGFLLRRFLIEGRERDGAAYFEIGGGSAGRSDQFYQAELGIHNLFRLRGGFDSLEHFYMDDARVLFSGVGSERLLLPAPLIPGLNTADAVEQALVTIGSSSLSQKQRQGEIELRVRIRPDLSLTADYRLRRRDGERPFGGTLGTTFASLISEISGSVAETIAPVESDTHEWSAALEYASERVQANLRYRGSDYHNRNASLTWENPFSALDLTGFPPLGLQPGVPRGRAALAPDNQLHQLSTDLGLRLPLAGRFTTSASWTRMRQNQRLLPATINPTLTRFDALSRKHADARVDHFLVQSKLRLKPIRAVTLQLKFRFFLRDNDTKYLAPTPPGGNPGYVVEDQYETDRVGAVPFSTRRYSLAGKAEWRFARRSRAGVEFKYEATHRNNRARREVRDHQLRAHLSTGLIPHTQLRVAYSFLRRRGSSYDTSRDQRLYAAGPGLDSPSGPEFSLREFRQFDLASNDRHELNLRANWLLGDRTDLSLVARYDTYDFRTSFGVTDMRVAELGVDTSIQLSPRFIAHGFASLEWRDRRMTTINNSAFALRDDFTAGSALFPLANRWSWDSETRGITVGAGLTARPHSNLELRLDYHFQHSRETADADFDPGGGALPPSVAAATARSHFPSLRQLDHVVDGSATYHWSDAIGTRIFYRFQYSTIDDFHQQGLIPVVNQNLFLGHVDDDYTVHVMGITSRFRY
jgi:MtrB/PioB family decaheme-associated outer membrane protein